MVALNHHDALLPTVGMYLFSARMMPSVVSNLKGCQILAGGKAEGCHPRNASGDKFDPGGVAASADSFISGTPAMTASLLREDRFTALLLGKQARQSSLRMPRQFCRR